MSSTRRVLYRIEDGSTVCVRRTALGLDSLFILTYVIVIVHAVGIHFLMGGEPQSNSPVDRIEHDLLLC